MLPQGQWNLKTPTLREHNGSYEENSFQSKLDIASLFEIAYPTLNKHTK